jgi:hypothetical protein
MSTVYPTSYPGSPSGPLSPLHAPSGTNALRVQPAITHHARNGSFQNRKDSTYSAHGRPSFSGFNQVGGAPATSRQSSRASAAPTDATIKYPQFDLQRRGTGLTTTTAQFTSASGYRTMGKQHRRPPDGSWATMDPDEVFRRLNVAEVKKVEAQLRSVSLMVQLGHSGLIGRGM